MGSMFRSEDMALCQIFLQPEAAYPTISELGERGTVQFRDLNEEVHPFQRKFINEVRRCDEMERKLRFMESEIKKDNVEIPDVPELPRAPMPREINNLEAFVETTEHNIREVSENAINLKSDYLQLLEIRYVLEKAENFFMDSEIPEELGPQGLSFVAGVVQRSKAPSFERMLWRISRGNVFMRRVDIDEPLEDPKTGNEVYKTVFVAFFQGEQLKSRVKKVCAGFHASICSCPNTNVERQNMLKDVRTRLEDITLILNQTKDHRERVLVGIANELQNWIVMVRKMKAIYHTLNMFNMDVSRKCMIGECWIPVKNISLVQNVLKEGADVGGSAITSFINVIETNENPPTYNKTNRFTQGFQNLIDSYGVASYHEANPALYTIITFPFLFAVMFGDAGHGVIILLFGAYMCYWEKQLIAKKIKNEVWNIFFGGRYIILLMGIFAIYTGLIYNDIFSKSFNIFGSSWNVTNPTIAVETEHLLNPRYDDSGSPYIFGLDPVWQLAKNKIIFMNSYKMKLSIIFGVIHMIFGVCVGVVNHVHFRTKINILLEFLPQLIFLVFLFFYMVFMMFHKWINYGARYDDIYGSSCAPSVLILFINMMLFKHSEPPKGCNEYMFDFQPDLQKAFVFVSLACIPILLLGKPIYFVVERKLSKKKVPSIENHKNEEEEEEEEPLSEIFIHQAIHTIEYVLSTISHTASYLRLWALSLAHAQLSEILWGKLFQMGLKNSDYMGALFIFIFFAIWAFFTIAILVMMEGLSAFLHTLRLHWVEFMSKFYMGLGYPFEPFCFKTIMDAEDEAD